MSPVALPRVERRAKRPILLARAGPRPDDVVALDGERERGHREPAGVGRIRGGARLAGDLKVDAGERAWCGGGAAVFGRSRGAGCASGARGARRAGGSGGPRRPGGASGPGCTVQSVLSVLSVLPVGAVLSVLPILAVGAGRTRGPRSAGGSRGSGGSLR